MLELNLCRAGVPWLFGHNHQKSFSSSAEKSRSHLYLLITLFKCSHSYEGGSFCSASLFHGEVLISLNSATVTLCSVPSSMFVCAKAIKTSVQKVLSVMGGERVCFKKLNEV